MTDSLAPTSPSAEITFIIDRSGSMGSIASDVDGGFREFAKAQLPGTLFNLVQFDDRYEIPKDRVAGADLLDYKLVPRGMTALHDAIGKTLTDLKARYALKRPGKIIIVVVTDGHENASKEFTHETTSKLIEECQGADWEFVFLAADQNAISAGVNLGFTARKSLSFHKSNVGVRGAFKSLVSNSVNYVSGASASMDYSAADREVQTGAGLDASLNDVTAVETSTDEAQPSS